MRPSQRRRPTYDFLDQRRYTPGDDIRFVDWNASARQEHIFVRQGADPQQVNVLLILDCSASMAWGGPPKSEAMSRLAAALGYVALGQFDRLFVIPVGGVSIASLGPLTGKGQVPAVLQYLASLTWSGRLDWGAAMRAVIDKVRGGMIFIISDLLSADALPTLLDHYPQPMWEVTVLHLMHPHELKPDVRGSYRLLDIESGEGRNYDVSRRIVLEYERHVKNWRERQAIRMQEAGVHYCFLRSDWPLGEQMIPVLHRARILQPV